MRLPELLELLRTRLNRKFRKAERAFLAEKTLKKTDNCLNRGRHLGGAISHCKINALGGHEAGASQCWDEKASICPYFELRHSTSKIKTDFHSMSLAELSIRWPSLAELIRLEHLIIQLDELKEDSCAPSSESPVPSVGRDLLQDTAKSGTGTDPGHVFGVVEPPGSGDPAPAGSSSTEDRRSDRGSPGVGAEDRTGVPLANLRRSRDRSDPDRAAV